MSASRLLPIGLIVVLGILVGLGTYTFAYARGYSYLSDDPLACVNCHVMRDNHDSWVVSSHRTVTCNGCHVPHDPIGKWLTKAENGFAHSFAFTFEDPQVIQIKRHSLNVVERNCVDCHQAIIADTMLDVVEEERTCTRCHRRTGHAL